jgi:Fur family peroxide stress response transcriptional regulator
MLESKDRLEELTNTLKERGYRITPQRIAVLKVTVANHDHPSVEQIYEQVKVDFPMTSLGTVYKTINMLKEIGEVLELGFSDGSNRYDGNKPYPHPHLICVQCNEIIDPDVNTVEELPRQLGDETGYQILSHRLDFYGICPTCQQKS